MRLARVELAPLVGGEKMGRRGSSVTWERVSHVWIASNDVLRSSLRLPSQAFSRATIDAGDAMQ